MRATLRITWLILSLGFLCHNVCSDTPAEMKTSVTNTHNGAVPATPTATVISTSSAATTTTLAVAISQNSISTHAITSVTSPTMKTEHASKGTQTESDTVTQAVIMSTTENKTGNDLSTKETSSTSTAVITSSSKNMAMTAMSHSSNSLTVAAPEATKAAVVSAEPSQTLAHVTTTVTEAIHTIKEGFKAPTSTVAPTMSQKGSSKSSDPLPKNDTVTAVATSLSERTQPSSTRTPDFPQQTLTIASTTTTTTTTTTITAPTTTTTTITAPTTTTTTITITTTPTTSPLLRVFQYSHNTKEESTDKNLEEVCKKLMVNFAAGNCTLKYYKQQNGTIKINSVETNGRVNASIAQQYYEEITTKPKDNKTLIAILASCIALLIMIVILAACASHHRKPYNENQQHLTEELQTVENGYHDNPTLEVMEVQPEMQEKKVVLNGEFNDSWIVPFDNLLKEDIPDEEDTHL